MYDTAQVLLRPGSGAININGIPYDQYFADISVRAHLVQPLLAAPQIMGRFNAEITVEGSGASAQVGSSLVHVHTAPASYLNIGSCVAHVLCDHYVCNISTPMQYQHASTCSQSHFIT